MTFFCCFSFNCGASYNIIFKVDFCFSTGEEEEEKKIKQIRQNDIRPGRLESGKELKRKKLICLFV